MRDNLIPDNWKALREAELHGKRDVSVTLDDLRELLFLANQYGEATQKLRSARAVMASMKGRRLDPQACDATITALQAQIARR